MASISVYVKNLECLPLIAPISVAKTTFYDYQPSYRSYHVVTLFFQLSVSIRDYIMGPRI
jgi:hypothetical protein